MAKRRAEIFRAKSGFSYDDENGSPVTVNRGDLVRRGHPVLKGRDELFEPVDNKVRFDVEEATAEPGAKRGPQGSTTRTEHAPAEKPPEKPAQHDQGGVKGGGTQAAKGITTGDLR